MDCPPQKSILIWEATTQQTEHVSIQFVKQFSNNLSTEGFIRIESKQHMIMKDFLKPAVLSNKLTFGVTPKITCIWETGGSQPKVGVPGVKSSTEQRANQCWPTG